MLVIASDGLWDVMWRAQSAMAELERDLEKTKAVKSR